MENIVSSDDNYAEMQIFHGQFLALARATVPKTHNYNDGGRVWLGDYLFELGRTYSVDEFEKEFNKNEIVKAKWDGSWTLKPVDNIYGISGSPVNTYENQWGVRKRIEQRGSNYFLVDVKTLDIKQDFCHWMPGEFFDTNHYKAITSQNALTVLPFGNSVAISGTGMEFGAVNWVAGNATDILPNKVLSSLESEEQHETLALRSGDFYVTTVCFIGCRTQFRRTIHVQCKFQMPGGYWISVIRSNNGI